MTSCAHITYKSNYSKSKVLAMQVLRYIQAGYLLHLITISSVILVYYLSSIYVEIIQTNNSLRQFLIYGYLIGYFLSLIFFSQFDARSRYQNYKMAKDKLYEYGFDSRLLRPFVYSRCQRDAIAVAAYELNFRKEWNQLNKKLGFRWYHILPHMVVRNPLILFTKEYWDKTLFVKTYHSKYFLW